MSERQLTMLHLMKAKVPSDILKTFQITFGNSVQVSPQICRKLAHVIDWRIIAARVLSYRGRQLAKNAFGRVYARYQIESSQALREKQVRVRRSLREHIKAPDTFEASYRVKDWLLQTRLREQYAMIFAYLYLTDLDREEA